MANLVDLYIVYRILRMLTTPYEDWEAYKTGVIDKDGKIIVKPSSRSQAQKDSYTKFDNLMLKLKNVLGTIPFGRTKLASYAAALLLLKEQDTLTEENIEERFLDFYKKRYLTEKWSDKYKKSIDCNNPKGFSQKAHCQGKKKNEEIANVASSGQVAGLGEHPPVGKKAQTSLIRRGKFANTDTFIVSSDLMKKARMGKKKYVRYEKYVGNDEIGMAIREFGLKYPKKPIILQDEKTGGMIFLRYGRSGLFENTKKKVNEETVLINESDIEFPKGVRQAVKQAGGKIYQIGGVVRDQLLGKVSKDLDILIIGFELRELEHILSRFGKTNMVGKSFGIIKFVPKGKTEEIDVAVPRIDVKSTGKGHKDVTVKLGKGITLKQDQLRRDFTINAIAKDVDTGELIDVLDGQGVKDIKHKLIRAINPNAFEDDPLRMLRAFQLAARNEFTIEKETLKQIKKDAHLITSISPSRFDEEFKKMYNKSKKPSIGVKYLHSTGVMEHIFPKAKNYSSKIDNIPKGNYPTFLAFLTNFSYGDETQKIIQEKTKASNMDARSAQSVVMWTKVRDIKDKFKIFNFAKDKSPNCIKSIDAFETAIGGKPISKTLNEFPIKSIKDLKITGKDLFFLKGRDIGIALNYATELVFSSGKNEKEYLIKQIKNKFSVKEQITKKVLNRLQMMEDVTRSDLDKVETYADKLFKSVGIDVEFTRHFLDRVNDIRNKKDITIQELASLFKKTYEKYGKKIASLGDNAEAVINDMKTDINMPFVLDLNRKTREIELIAKTVMRKKNFMTRNLKLRV